jgi:AraC-like DNA-binding protein
MESIPVFRAAHMLPYIEVLRQVGVPVTRRLCDAKLPTMLADKPDAYLPLLQSFVFLMENQRSEGIDDLAVRGAQRLESAELDMGLQAALVAAPTLHVALREICRLGALEAPCVDWWLDFGASAVRICSRINLSREAQGWHYAEWHRNLGLVAIVRAFAGPRWCPSEMAFESDIAPSRFAQEQFPDTRLLIGQNSAWIDVPRSMLCLSTGTQVLPGASRRAAAKSVKPPKDFVTSLKALLKTYLSEGCPTIRLSAEISGMSVRTLQRRLTDLGLSYSDLLNCARFEAAAYMLGNSDTKVIDVAYELGYEDPSNFARAFRRIAGISPREYRRVLATESAGSSRIC